jgi:hypothetical protein
VGATEQGFYDLARSRGFRLERQVAVVGLTSRGHEEATLAGSASPRTLRRLADIFAVLRGDATRLASKRALPLRLDFYLADLDLFIEVDETQHFTTDRAHTLRSYEGESGTWWRWSDEYWRFIATWSNTADRYRASKAAVDFPRPGGRRAQRAYLDAVRDLLAPELGIRVLRIAAPECDAALAFKRFETALAA